MSANTAAFRLHEAPFLNSVDPGSGEAIYVDRFGHVIPFDIAAAGAETMTLAAPTRAGLTCALVARTVGASGVRTVTVTGGVNAAGDTTLVFDAEGDFVELKSYPVGDGTYRWRIVRAEGVAGAEASRQVVLNLPLNGDMVDQAFFIADRAYQVTRIDYVHATLATNGSAVNAQITKDTGIDAPGGGANLLTNNTNAGFDCKATINTVQNGTLTATAADLLLAAGNRLSIDFAGTVTSLAGVQVTVTLRPI